MWQNAQSSILKEKKNMSKDEASIATLKKSIDSKKISFGKLEEKTRTVQEEHVKLEQHIASLQESLLGIGMSSNKEVCICVYLITLLNLLNQIHTCALYALRKNKVVWRLSLWRHRRGSHNWKRRWKPRAQRYLTSKNKVCFLWLFCSFVFLCIQFF